MFKKVEECPICDNKSFTNFIVAQDHLVSQDSFAISECTKCKFKMTSPRPMDEELHKYYQSENYISHTGKGNNIINSIYKIVRNYTIAQKYKFIKDRVKKGSILDFGCGTGDFLKYFQKKGWIIRGIEPNNEARKIASEKTNIEIYSKLIKDKSKYTAITLWHVLEHIPDINQTLELLKTKLDKKGRIFVAVPNCNSLDAQHYSQYWAAYDLPRHLYHFTPDTMKKLMKKHNLKIKEILPMYFDAYYVSMLSEKYRTDKNNFISAFKMGYLSNKTAAKNNQYSSLIYVIKK